MKKKSRAITAEELDRRFDAGEDIMKYADLDTAVFRVNVDFPAATVSKLDRESARHGVTRQSLIKIWITERLDQIAQNEKKTA